MTFKFKNSKNTRRPNIGDVFFGEDEFTIGRKKSNDSDVVEVCLNMVDCSKKEMVREVFYSKGKVFTNVREKKVDVSVLDETRKSATWIVENIEQKDKLELLHSVLPESFLITARRLKDSKFDEEGGNG